MIIGHRSLAGSAPLEMQADSLYLGTLGTGLLPRDFTVGALVARMDALGAGSGQQVFRPALAAGELAALLPDPGAVYFGEEVAVPIGMSERWVWMPFAKPVTLRAGTRPLAGFWSGASNLLVRSRSLDVTATADDYGIGAAPMPYLATGDPTLPAFGENDTLFELLLVGVETWPVPDVPDEAIAALPLDVASAYFGAGGTVGDPLAASAGWHYTHDAPPPPASCIVRTGGPLEDLVGERLRITASTEYGVRSIVLYVIDEQPFEDELAAEDLSLSRIAFESIAPLTTDLLSVMVEVMG